MRYVLNGLGFVVVAFAYVALAAAPLVAPANVATPAKGTNGATSFDKAATSARVESYLTSLTTVTADFNQVNPDGSLAAGKFYLKRPGKMRWAYAPPTPILLLSDGKRVIYYDSELDQVTYIGMDDTLAGFLAQKVITLDSATTRLTKLETLPGLIRATMVQKTKPDEGSLTLEFSDNPLALRQMSIVDATGQTTHVQLQNATFGAPVDDKLFLFQGPRQERAPKRPLAPAPFPFLRTLLTVQDFIKLSHTDGQLRGIVSLSTA